MNSPRSFNTNHAVLIANHPGSGIARLFNGHRLSFPNAFSRCAAETAELPIAADPIDVVALDDRLTHQRMQLVAFNLVAALAGPQQGARRPKVRVPSFALRRRIRIQADEARSTPESR